MLAELLALALSAGEPSPPPASRRALALLQKAVAAHPDDPDVLTRYARVLGELGLEPEARRASEEAARLRPRPGLEQALALGKAAWDRGEALPAMWEEAMARFTVDARLPRNLGFARYSRGEHEAAERLYRRALELAPGDPGIRADLAWALLAQGRHDEARSLAESVLLERPDDAGAQGVVARTAPAAR
jgi:Flp pilus assembly protein TadD